MFIENGISEVGALWELAVVPIKTALLGGATPQPQPATRGERKIALMEEAGGVLVEKLLISGGTAMVQSKALEMIKAGRKLVLEGFPLEEIAAWCFTYNYRWRFHRDSSAQDAFILEPGKKFSPDAKDPGAKT